MADDVKIVRPDAPRDVVSQQGPAVTTTKFTSGTFRAANGPVVDRDSTCGTRGKHCWHDSRRTLTSYPGYAVEHCCFCGAQHHRSLAVPSQIGGHHGPFVSGGRTLSERADAPTSAAPETPRSGGRE